MGLLLFIFVAVDVLVVASVVAEYNRAIVLK